MPTETTTLAHRGAVFDCRTHIEPEDFEFGYVTTDSYIEDVQINGVWVGCVELGHFGTELQGVFADQLQTAINARKSAAWRKAA